MDMGFLRKTNKNRIDEGIWFDDLYCVSFTEILAAKSKKTSYASYGAATAHGIKRNIYKTGRVCM